MITVRKSLDRGYVDHGWLKSHHTFSFADYYDEEFMGFGPLRVINEDRIKGAMGFATHGHKDMEIISYIVNGALRHKDSMGNTEVIKPGEVQRMSAGTGVRHSEFNDLKDADTHLLQIWFTPEKVNINPCYEQKSFSDQLQKNEMILVASRDGLGDSILLNQDVNIYAVNSKSKGEKTLSYLKNRNIWIQVIRGVVTLLNQKLFPGDGAAITKEDKLDISWQSDSEFLVFDMV